ncbi:HPr kinase/phosphorylase [Sporosarcina sp. P21c]|uniref:HPr(Ser) kinase/phosphatase n=1 Tax=Sporosarcina TaxID=1569 RepID=UPI000A14FE94|nr:MULTISPECIES: HPr(Ser) kinase/phosphatase [Sporosarcina]ARJ38371.1 HPr kinase/phosphorylase [Sporosarcina ureae]PIC67317.1 HPr kinase/phosphorylase [Sporosarcina sp. P16a]PIC82189.1 HPr kinase/phosphorylase [Sporosarcina sp. P1]PIC90261.1 HPr kinase/phosphorylase [Sporosarcina sp. P21c]PIC92769.1 HPr kinase/phosphorylase [Sporosarcina sp. P25]
MGELTVEDIMNRFGLELIAGHAGIHKQILMSDISRPGLEMAGYFDYYPAERVQLIGRKEMSFLETLSAITRRKRLERLCSGDTPAFIIAHGEEGPKELSQLAEEKNIPVLRTDYKTTQFSGMLTNYLVGQLAPMTTVHGVLVDVYGVGVLITGGSGVGKSETALELIKKGHRLVADDSVEIRQVSDNILIGTSPKLLKHMLEIRGVGIIDLMTLFGASSVKDDKRVLLAVDLEIWDDNKHYDRLGIDEEKVEILDSQITKLSVPVRPGRNIAVIIEVAAMDYRMKRLGINAAEEFTKRLDQAIADNAELLEEEERD